MSIVAPGVVIADTLSQAWIETTKDVRDRGGVAFHTMTRIVDPNAEVPAIRDGYDSLLAAKGFQSAETVANTLFPSAIAAASGTPKELVERYRKHYGALRRFGPNKKGTYFGRVVAYPSPAGDRDQLVPLIDKLVAEHESAGPMSARYEVGVAVPTFAPHKDTSRRAFPCLSLLSFQLDGDRVHLMAQYRYEYLVEKGYGNYLGLARLLSYVAQASDLEVGQLTVTAGRIKADSAARTLAEHLGVAWAAA